MEHNRLTLSFIGDDRDVEPLYVQYYTRRYLKLWRLCMLISIVAYGSVGLMDNWIFPELTLQLWIIRYGYVIPWFFAALLITVTPYYQKAWQYVNFALILATGFGAVAMVVLTPEPNNNIIYFDSLCIVLFFGFALIRARFIVASLAALILSVSYVYVLLYVVDCSGILRANNLLVLCLINAVGMLIAYNMELADRKNFYLSHHLQRSNQYLEQRVADRTEDLSESNRALREQIKERMEEEAQRRKLEKQVRQVQKMDAIGTLAGGIAHDFNNILCIISGYCELVKTAPSMSIEKLIEYTDEIHSAATRGAGLVRQILTVSCQDEQAFKPVQIGMIVKEISKLIRATFPASIRIETEFESRSFALADPVQIHQIIMNLCTNAKHALEGNSGEIKIRLADVQVDARAAMQHPELKPGDYIQLLVSDTGCGMSPSVQERIFDPFFTTKDQGKGTGLGLSVVHGIVKNHGGTISVNSRQGLGTVFEILIPATDPPEFMELDTVGDEVEGHERLLYVDDEKSLVAATQEKLTRWGYAVTGMTDSLEAWRLFESDPERFDMIISDLAMPNLTGLQFAEKALSLRPGLPFVLCTGFSQKEDEAEAGRIGVRALLTKPVTTKVLCQTIRGIFETAN